MSFSAIINFRFSDPYVTDSAGQTFCLGDPYQTSRGGQSFGWSSGVIHAEDRTTAAGTVPEFAGINFAADSDGPAVFRLDLPAAGSYAVRLALGDAYAQSGMTCVLLDGPDGATLATVLSSASMSGAGRYYDATGVERSGPADWRANNAPVTVTVTGTALAIKLGNPTDVGGFTTLAHLEVTDATGGGGGGPAPLGLLHFSRPLITRVY